MKNCLMRETSGRKVFLLAPDLRVWSTFLGKTQQLKWGSRSLCIPGQESEREESRSLVGSSFSLWIGLSLWRVPTDLWVRSFPHSLSHSQCSEVSPMWLQIQPSWWGRWTIKPMSASYICARSSGACHTDWTPNTAAEGSVAIQSE